MTDAAAEVYARLRRETAGMLGFDLEKLSPSQDVRLNMVASLRLELDRMQSAQLRGEAIDTRELVALSEMLEGALRPVEVSGPVTGENNPKERLRRLIENVFAVVDEERAEAMEREEAVMAAEAAGASPPPPPEAPALDEKIIPLRTETPERQGPSRRIIDPDDRPEGFRIGWPSGVWRPFTHRF